MCAVDWPLISRLVVAVSAMGKTTDQLVALARQVSRNPRGRDYDLLLASGEQVAVARWGSAWRQHDAHIELRAGERGDMDRLLAAPTSASGRIDHVVHLWSLDTRSPETCAARCRSP